MFNKLCAIIFCATIILLFLWAGLSHSAEIPREKAVYALIGEFENDNMLAGACAIRNRGTLKGVYGLNSKRVRNRLYSSATLVKAVKAWEDSRTPSNCLLVAGAGHWLSVADMKTRPGWSYSCEMTYFSGKTYYFKCGR